MNRYLQRFLDVLTHARQDQLVDWSVISARVEQRRATLGCRWWLLGQREIALGTDLSGRVCSSEP